MSMHARAKIPDSPGQQCLDAVIKVRPLHFPPSCGLSLAEIAQKHNLTSLRTGPGGLQSVPGQVDFVAEFLKTQESYLVEAPTGSGKTFVALMCAAQTLSRPAGRVLFLTPMQHLVSQIGRDAKIASTLEPAVMANLSGDSSSEPRIPTYQDPNKRLVVATPEIIQDDISSGALRLKDFSLVIFDEVHRAQGNYAYTPVMAAVVAAGVRRLGLSASVAESAAERHALQQRLKAERYRRLNIAENHKYHTYEYVTLDAPFTQARELLAQEAQQTAQRFVDELNRCYHGLDSLSSPLLRQIDQLNGKVRTTLTNTKGWFVLPSAGEYLDLHRKFSQFATAVSYKAVGEASEMLADLGRIRYRDSALSTIGRYSFLNFAADEFLSYYLEKGKEQPQYLRRIHDECSPVKRALDLMAADTPYAELFRCRSFAEVASRVLLSRETLSQTQVHGQFLELGFQALVEDRRLDHPIEGARRLWLTGDPRATGGGKVIVRVKEAAQVDLVAARINRIPGQKAVTLAGRKSMTRPELALNIARFNAGEANRIVMTSAGDEGLDLKNTSLLLIETPPTQPIALEQLGGRPGRRADLTREANFTTGGIVSLVTRDTEDEYRHRTVVGKLAKMKREREFA